MASEILENWDIPKYVHNNNYYVCGVIASSCKRMKGQYINSEMILEITEEGNYFKVETIDGIYLLTKLSEEYYNAVYDIMDEIKEKRKKIMLTAEKLLSAGDCLVCDDAIMCYHSEDGIVFLQNIDNHFSYPKENFYMSYYCFSCISEFEYDKKYENGCMYELDLQNGTLKRRDYKSICLIS